MPRILSTPWTSQPQDPVGIDLSNPSGALFAYNGATQTFATKDRVRLPDTRRTRIILPDGAGVNTGTQSFGLDRIPFLPLSVFAVCRPYAWGGSSNTLISYFNGSQGFYFSVAPGGQLRFTIYGVADYTGSTNLWDANIPVKTVGAVAGNGFVRFYVNGVYLEQVAIAASISGSGTLATVTANNGGAHTSSYLAGVFGYARLMSDGDVAAESRRLWQIFTTANRPLYFDLGAGGGAQTLTQSSRFDNAPTFFTHTLSSSIALSQSSRYDNTNALSYTHTLTPGTVTLSQSARFDNTNALSYVHTLTQANSPQTLTQDARFDNAASFFTHTLSYAQTLAQSSTHTNTSSFFTHSLSTNINLSQSSRFDNSNALAYSHVVTKSITLDASRYDNDNLFFAHVLTPGAVTLSQSNRYDGSATFFAHVLTQAGNQTLVQSATETNANSFYAHAISFSYPDVARPSSTAQPQRNSSVTTSTAQPQRNSSLRGILAQPVRNSYNS